ncbi:MAG: class I SAM-dependent methyltransferase [Haloferacaceae archaeon]
MTEDRQKRTVRDGYDELATAYADRRTPDERELALLDDLSGRLHAGDAVLDAGSGRGTPVATSLADGNEVVCLDVSREQLVLAGETVPGARRVQGDLAALPFADDAFAAVCAFNSVIHVPTAEHDRLYREFARVLAPGGWLVVSLGTAEWEGSNDDWLDTGVEMAWSFPDLDTSLGYLDDAGFDVHRRDVVGDDIGDGAWTFVVARFGR